MSMTRSEQTDGKIKKWTREEVRILLSIRAEEKFDKEIQGTSGDVVIYKWITRRLTALGVSRTQKQATSKLKTLKCKFMKLLSQSDSTVEQKRRSFPFYDLCDAIWGHSRVGCLSSSSRQVNGSAGVNVGEISCFSSNSVDCVNDDAASTKSAPEDCDQTEEPILPETSDYTDVPLLLEENNRLRRKITSLELEGHYLKSKVANLEQIVLSAVDITDFQYLLEDTLDELKRNLLVNRRPLLLHTLNRYRQKEPHCNQQSGSPPNIQVSDNCMGQRSDHSEASDGGSRSQPGRNQLKSVVKMEWDVDSDEEDDHGRPAVPSTEAADLQEEVDIHQSPLPGETNMMRKCCVGSTRKTGASSCLKRNSENDASSTHHIPSCSCEITTRSSYR